MDFKVFKVFNVFKVVKDPNGNFQNGALPFPLCNAQINLPFPSLIRTLASPKILRLGIIKLKFASALDFSYLCRKRNLLS